ncbi:MAG: DUF4382 domain-containing protein [Planctomycetes bacterium]|nr:DUF4382 domain-containing protein [Planctomycetota bacterium]
MKLLPLFRNFVQTVAAFLGIVLLASCGSGGGGGGSRAAAQPGQTGSVAILFTDGPTSQFSAIHVTVTRIELISDSRQVVIFTGRKVINLLSLDKEAELFSLSSEVPTGVFSKIRLLLDKVELVKLTGEIVEADLVANGKLDLNPREAFTVRAGETLILQLDLDAEKSIHIVKLPNREVFRFRPVVFVKIIQRLIDQKLARLKGEIEAIDAERQAFRLCLENTAFMTARLGGGDDGRGSNRCVDVFVSADTSIFNSQAEPIAFGDLKAGDLVTAIGRLKFLNVDDDDDEDDDEEDDDDIDDHGGRVSHYDHKLVLQAEVIEVGDFLKLSGSLKTAPDAAGRFDFALDDGQGFEDGTVLKVQIQEKTRFFNKQGDEIDASALQAGRLATVDGVLALSDTGADILKASLIVVDTRIAGEPVKLEGTIKNLDAGEGTFDLEKLGPNDITETACVVVPQGDAIFLITEMDGKLDSERIGLDRLQDGQEADLYGNFDGSSCFIPETILVFEVTEPAPL